MRYGRGKPEDTDDEECTCRTPVARSTDIDPPAYKSIRDPWCPVHGRDPDEAYEERRQRRAEMWRGYKDDDYE
jgi:hypothetical protein